MAPNFGLATQEWRLEDSDSDDAKPDPSRYETERKPVLLSSIGEPVAAEDVDESPDNIDPEQPPPSTQTKPQIYDWSRRDIWKYLGVLAVTSAVIIGFPLAEESSLLGSKSRSASLPPRNILQSHAVGLAKFDISALDIVCRGSQLPICDFTQSLRNLDLTSSQNDQEIESLGFDLNTLLRPTKMATRKEECSYFLQLQLDINLAWDRTLQIQGSLKIGLDSIYKALSLITESRSSAEAMLTSMDEAANGEMWKIGTRHGRREKAYRDNKRWLDVFEDYTQKLQSRAVAWDWELGRQNRLQKDLKEVEKQIKGLWIGVGQSVSANSSCTAFNMQRVERRLLDTMMRAAENDATAESLGKYYGAL